MNIITRFLRHSFSIAAVTLSLTALPLTGAAADIYLELQGIPGESTAEDFKNAIDVQAFSWGLYNATTTTTIAGKAELQDLAISKAFDSASPKLFIRAAAGTVIPKAKLTVVRRTGDAKPMPFMVIELENVIVSSLQLSDSQGSDRPYENVSLAFTKIKITHYDEKNNPTSETWDAAKRK